MTKTNDGYLILDSLSGNEPAQLNTFQTWLEPNVDVVVIVWWVVWVSVLVFLILNYIIKPTLQNLHKSKN